MSKANVLLVDDNPANLLALEAVLESLGHNLLKARSGEEALELLADQDFAVVLLDIQMHGLDGFETARRIRNRQKTRYTPIIFLTAYEDNRLSAERAYSLGAVDYLVKPLVPVILRAKVDGFVELFEKTQQVIYQAEQLRELERREFERKIAEENARSRQQRETYHTTLASIGDAVITTDTDGCVNFLNPVAHSLTGWSREEASRQPLERILKIVNEQTREPGENAVARVVHEGIIVGFAPHSILIARDGTERPIEASAAPIKDEGGQVLGVVIVFRDVTQRRRQEEERERMLAAERSMRSELEDANRAKDHFLAVLSHELRTPLNPILLGVTAMLERPIRSEDVRPTLEMIRDNVVLQSRLIDDLLDVMRIVRGKLPLHSVIADCHALIQQAVEICRSELPGKDLILELDLSAPNSHVNADPARLQQVFWNLIKNAIKFTPKGGSITIRTRNRGPEHLIVEVCDTGIGIDPEVLPRIFEPFDQGAGAITRKFGGLGLGLAIGRGIVEAHGGSLVAESEGRHRGATFRLQLKAMPAISVATYDRPKHAGRSSTDDSPPSRSLKVLLVEDEQATLGLMARLLGGLGHDVRSASTIALAWEQFQGDSFDLIISDIGLPDGTGLELMRRVKEHRQVPAIALTGYGMEEDIQQSRAAGFTAHMTKPIDFTKLETMIRQIAKC